MPRLKQFLLLIVASLANQVYFSIARFTPFYSQSITWFFAFFPGLIIILVGLHMHTTHVAQQAKSIFGKEEIGFNNFWVNFFLIQCLVATFSSCQTFAVFLFYVTGAGFGGSNPIFTFVIQIFTIICYNLWLTILEFIALFIVTKLVCTPTTKRNLYHLVLLIEENFFYVFYRSLFISVDNPWTFIALQVWQLCWEIISYTGKMTFIFNGAVYLATQTFKNKSLIKGFKDLLQWRRSFVQFFFSFCYFVKLTISPQHKNISGEYKKVIMTQIEDQSAAHLCRVLAENSSLLNLGIGIALLHVRVLGTNLNSIPVLNIFSQSSYETLMLFLIASLLIEVSYTTKHQQVFFFFFFFEPEKLCCFNQIGRSRKHHLRCLPLLLEGKHAPPRSKCVQGFALSLRRSSALRARHDEYLLFDCVF